MSICGNTLITSGIQKLCADINGAIGLDKDLILVNYDDFDRDATLIESNREADDSNKNVDGLTNIILKAGAVQYIFEGTDYSVVPTITPEVREDGLVWYVHSLLFTAYSKTAKTRKIFQDLGGARVIAIAKDRSSGLMELFGAEQGLKMTGIERAYTGTQNSNFYNVTLASPDLAIMRESSLGELAVGIVTL